MQYIVVLLLALVFAGCGGGGIFPAPGADLRRETSAKGGTAGGKKCVARICMLRACRGRYDHRRRSDQRPDQIRKHPVLAAPGVLIYYCEKNKGF